MKPTIESLQSKFPDVDRQLLENHLSRLTESYFERFSPDEIAQHVSILSRLSSHHPIELLFRFQENNYVDCTVLSFDYPAVFSLITGVFSGTGFTIISGDIFTYERSKERSAPIRHRTGFKRVYKPAPEKRRKIVDVFSGTIDAWVSPESWAGLFREQLTSVISLFEMAGEEHIGQAKKTVNELVAARLTDKRGQLPEKLYPVHIDINNRDDRTTRLSVIAEDTFGFLYSLSNALSLQGISIEHVEIRTKGKRVEDQIDIVDKRGRAIDDPVLISRIKLSVLLTKQFTLFLSSSPAPYAALLRFEQLVKDIVRTRDKDKWTGLLSNPFVLKDLARLLGASDFLWEDFIRLQYEELLPLFTTHVQNHRFSQPSETVEERLEHYLQGANNLNEQQRRLNEFKDKEIFLIDLDHILRPHTDFRVFAHRLTILAEAIVWKAVACVFDHLKARYGIPLTVGHLPARFAVFGLGKMGGRALGYASDIELLFVYNDNGRTGGTHSIENREFYELLVRETVNFIKTKREGIFTIDLRLRPYGNDGPLACSLESFCRYYGPKGPAHSYERLSLVRLRPFGGDEEFGAQVERLRDDFIYASESIKLAELRELRNRQFQEKTGGGKLNAKFSPGALVDLEYAVQILQVMYGKDNPALRTPAIHEALRELTRAQVLREGEDKRLDDAYSFLRRLINGLRMLRGSAHDLFLPSTHSEEFLHLARRIGYERKNGIDPSTRLHLDFETYTAEIRAFVERHFGRASLPGPAIGNVVDLLLSDTVPVDVRERILRDTSFENTDLAYTNFRKLAGEGNRQKLFARLSILATDIIRKQPDADMALNNWERFVTSLSDPAEHYTLLLAQPTRLEILLSIFSHSQFLAQTLIGNPTFWDWVTSPQILHHNNTRNEMLAQLRHYCSKCIGHDEWLDAIRVFRRREILRIGTRDICLHVPIERILADISVLAESLTQVSLERVFHDDMHEEIETIEKEKYHNFCIVAMGKLGGSELNYSSDIDLIGIYENHDELHEKKVTSGMYGTIMEKTCDNLTRHTKEGYVYRVDLRLRPYGGAGQLVYSTRALDHYYRENASLWEIQALLKMRPIAGDLDAGWRFIKNIHSLYKHTFKTSQVVKSIRSMRAAAGKKPTLQSNRINIKDGVGGIRDVEFLAQGLQLLNAEKYPEIVTGNTLDALRLLADDELLPKDISEQLKNDYVFLRRIEHLLQIYEDRQIHTIPNDERRKAALSKRVLGVDADGVTLTKELEERRNRIHSIFHRYLVDLVSADN